MIAGGLNVVRPSGLRSACGEGESQSLRLRRIVGEENGRQVCRADKGGNHQPRISRAARGGDDRIQSRDIGGERCLAGVDEHLEPRSSEVVGDGRNAKTWAAWGFSGNPPDNKAGLTQSCLDTARGPHPCTGAAGRACSRRRLRHGAACRADGGGDRLTLRGDRGRVRRFGTIG
jgi:hypothetical protein